MYCSSIFVFICVILYLEVMIMVVKYYFAMSCCNQWWFQQYCIVIVFQSIAILWYFKFSKYCNKYCKIPKYFNTYCKKNQVLQKVLQKIPSIEILLFLCYFVISCYTRFLFELIYVVLCLCYVLICIILCCVVSIFDMLCYYMFFRVDV